MGTIRHGRNVYIMTVGFDPEPTMELSGVPADKIYLLNDDSDPEATECLRRLCEHFKPISDVVSISIDCYDYKGIYSTVLDIGMEEMRAHDDVGFFVNFSRGTAIAVSAVSNAAFELDAELYYVKYKKAGGPIPSNERLIRIEPESLRDPVFLTPGQQEILMFFKGDKELKTSQLRELYSPNCSKGSFSRHTDALRDKGLIVSTRSGRDYIWKASWKGRMEIKRIEIRSIKADSMSLTE